MEIDNDHDKGRPHPNQVLRSRNDLRSAEVVLAFGSIDEIVLARATTSPKAEGPEHQATSRFSPGTNKARRHTV